MAYHQEVPLNLVFAIYVLTHPISRGLEVASPLGERGLHTYAEGPVIALVERRAAERHGRRHWGGG